MTFFTHWHVAHNQQGCPPESGPLCFDDAEDAVRALGEAIQEWAESEQVKPETKQDPEAAFAAGLAEIFVRASSPEFADEVARVRQRGTGYHFGDRLHWAVPAHGPGEACDSSQAQEVQS